MHGPQQEEHGERNPLQADQLEQAALGGDMVGRVAEDGAADERGHGPERKGPRPSCPRQDVIQQQVGAPAGHDEGKEHDQVIDGRQGQEGLQGYAEQAVEDVQRVELQADAVRPVDPVRVKWIGVQVEERPSWPTRGSRGSGCDPRRWTRAWRSRPTTRGPAARCRRGKGSGEPAARPRSSAAGRRPAGWRSAGRRRGRSRVGALSRQAVSWG